MLAYNPFRTALLMDDFLRQLGRRIEFVPQRCMHAFGWNLVSVEPVDLRSESVVARSRMAIDAFILEVWPNPLRISYDREDGEQVAIWTRTLPLFNVPFPAQSDIDHGLRVICAAGAARANASADQIRRADRADHPALLSQAEHEQEAFELVTAAIAAMR